MMKEAISNLGSETVNRSFLKSDIFDDEEEEEFDDTEIETPVRLTAVTHLEPRNAPQRSISGSPANYTRFRTVKRSPLRNPPINSSELTPNNASIKTNKPTVNANTTSPNNVQFTHSPPTNLKFNISALSPPRSKSKPKVKQYEKQHEKQYEKQPQPTPTSPHPESSNIITEEPSLHITQPSSPVNPANSPEQNAFADISREVIIERVNNTIDSLMQSKNRKFQSKHNNVDLRTDYFDVNNDEEPGLEEEPELLQDHPWTEEPELVRDDHWPGTPNLLGVSTPLIDRFSRKRTRTSIEDPDSRAGNWWPSSKWAKLRKIVLSKHINRDEAINSPLLMDELGCKNKSELESRYDFLACYKVRTHETNGKRRTSQR